MADRRVKVIIEAEVAAYRRGMEQATDATKKLSSEAEKVSGSTGKAFDGLRKNADDLQQVGGVLAGTGAALTALAGSAAKSAMDWESAFAGVKKTVDDSAEGYAQLEGELRNLATTLPTTHTEVAAVAEAAGQLGVARDDIVGFTGTMIDLGETTNLTADEAATAIAQISNVMGTMDREGSEGVERFGATLVELGNNGASTESEILDMAQRIAGAAATVGASESDVLALSNTLASMGIRAEMGGGVAQRVILRMRTAADEGGESLEAFARVAGTSAEEFAQKFRESPMDALAMVAGGINGVNEAGGNVTETLREMGIKGTEETQVMLALANSGDPLTDSLRQGEDAWKSNSALAEEAQKRYETAEAKIAIAWNQIKDAAIEAGGAILPVVVEVMEVVVGLADVFAGLPDPVKGAIGGLAGVAGVALTVAGGVGMIVRPALDAVDAFKRLSGISGPTKTKLDAIGKTTAVAAVLAAAAGAAIQLHNASQDAAPSLEAVANALLNMDEAGDSSALNELFRDGESADLGSRIMGVRTEVTGLADALALVDPSSLGDHMQNFGADVFGIENHASRAQETLSNLDKTLATMGVEEAGEKMNGLRLEMEAAGRSDFSSWSELQRVMPEYTSAVEAAANATGQSTTEAELFQAAMGNLPAHMRPVEEAATDVAAATGDAADSLGALAQVDAESNVGGIAEAMAVLSDESLELEDRLSGVLDALFRMGILEQTAAEAAASFEAALDGVAAAVEENGATLDITTEAGRNNQAALSAIADAGRGLVTSLAEAGASQGELRDALERTYIEAYNAATAMGATAEEAEILARRAVGLNDLSVDIDTYLSDAALVAAEALGGAIEAIPGYRGVSVVVSDDGTTGQVQESIEEIDGVRRTVFVTTDGTEIEVQAKIENINGVDRTVWVDDQGTIYGTQQDIYAVTGKTVDIEAQTTGLGTVEAELAWAARTRYSTIQTAVEYVGGGWESRQQQSVGVLRRAQGGIASLPGFSAGGVLPRTGLGTDMILGVTSSGMPIARVDGGEMIVRRSSTDMYRGVLDRINRNDPSVHHLRGYAGGGRAGREWSAQSLAPQITVQAPGSSYIDSAAIGAAVHAAMAGWRPMVQVGDRAIYGMMRRAEQATSRR